MKNLCKFFCICLIEKEKDAISTFTYLIWDKNLKFHNCFSLCRFFTLVSLSATERKCLNVRLIVA